MPIHLNISLNQSFSMLNSYISKYEQYQLEIDIEHLKIELKPLNLSIGNDLEDILKVLKAAKISEKNKQEELSKINPKLSSILIQII